MKKFKVFLLLIVTLVILSVSNVFAYSQVQMGSRGDDVLSLQIMVSDVLGISLERDGQFGSGTRNAVIQYQKNAGLSADGICGTNTWSRLINDFANISCISDPYLVLRMGDRGSNVETLQRLLNNVMVSYLTVDGQYGSSTRAAVIDFQRAYNLPVDGEAGLITLAYLDRLYTQ